MINNNYYQLKNTLKSAIDDLLSTIEIIHDELNVLKIKSSQPDKATAKALLEFMAMDEGDGKENLKLLCAKEIAGYKIWLDFYCKENNCTQEEALNQILAEN